MRFILAIAVSIALLAFGPANSAKADCPNGACAATQVAAQPFTLQSGTVFTIPAQTKTITFQVPERQFIVTEKPVKAKRFKLNIFKKCGG